MNDRAEAYAPVLDDGVVWPADAIEVGRIVDAWGVKGGIKVQPFSSDPQALFCTKKWFLRPGDTPLGALPRPSAAPKGVARLAKPRFLQVKQARDQGDVVVATAEGLEDRNAAEALKGARVYVSRSAFPTPDEDEFYWVDLIGLDVVNKEGVALGKVVDLLDTGPNSVLRCEGEAGEDGKPVERLIPFVSAFIVSVSLADRRIVADWGLDY
jgi:16S rRNA processing protein RimM